MTSAPVEADELQARVAEGLAAAIALTEAASRSCGEALVRAARTVADSLSRGGKLLIAGNGGNAADAQHLAAEFVGKLVNDRRPLAAVALTTDTSALTAIGNDYGFEQVFARQVAALGRPGDVLLALSTSGRSPNVVAAAEYARQAGISTVALTGGGASPLRAGCDEAIVIPSRVTARIQECQLTLEHLLAECVEALLVPETAPPLTEPARSTRTLTPWPELLVERSRWDDAGRVVVWTSGCFDILHVGHLRSLQMAKEFGDILVVGLNDDENVAELLCHLQTAQVADVQDVEATAGPDDHSTGIVPPTPLDQQLRPRGQCSSAARRFGQWGRGLGHQECLDAFRQEMLERELAFLYPGRDPRRDDNCLVATGTQR